MTFAVIDKQTGKKPDLDEITATEAWADKLLWTRVDGFAISQDGSLVLMDMCGNYASCPLERFEVTFDSPALAAIEAIADDEFTAKVPRHATDGDALLARNSTTCRRSSPRNSKFEAAVKVWIEDNMREAISLNDSNRKPLESTKGGFRT